MRPAVRRSRIIRQTSALVSEEQTQRLGPCIKCGASERHVKGHCIPCKQTSAKRLRLNKKGSPLYQCSDISCRPKEAGSSEMCTSAMTRLAAKVSKEGPIPAHLPNLGPCWQWLGSTHEAGYGTFTPHNGYRPRFVHRLSWLTVNGAIPNGLCVLHRCDNRLCLRPDHLFLGTRADNAADRDAKGRQLKGEQQPRAVFRDEEVRMLRAIKHMTGFSVARIARAYQKKREVVGNALRGKTYKYVT